MKKLIISTLAVLALTTTAFATDLPNKSKAPAAKPVLVEKEKAASVDSLAVSYGQDLGTNFGAKTGDNYSVTYKHSLGGGLSVSGVASSSQATGALLKQNLEAQVNYSVPVFAGLSVNGGAGIGERFTTTNFPYYALYAGTSYKVVDGLSVTPISYRYRNAFDEANDYKSHRLAAGVTYDITSAYSVGVTVSRSYDATWNATGDGISGSFTVKF